MPIEKWRELFAKTHKAPITQSYEYAQATCRRARKTAKWGLIRINGKDAGLVQITQAGAIKNLLHAVELDLGPIWFDGFGSADDYSAFFSCYNKTFPKRFGRARRILVNAPPDANALENIRVELPKLRMRAHDSTPYQTIWLDLSPTKDELRANLKGKWRNMLNKAEKQNMQISFTNDVKELPLILKHYEIDKRKKGYSGPSVSLLRDLAAYFNSSKNVLIGKATLDNKLIAAIVIFVHGRSATYQIGWSSDDGRKNAAHNALLWNAMCELKDRHIQYFDLGGINDETAKNVKRFKEGMGGTLSISPGHYI